MPVYHTDHDGVKVGGGVRSYISNNQLPGNEKMIDSPLPQS